MLPFRFCRPTPPSRGVLRDDRGTTSIEYAILAGFIALAIVIAVTGIGGTLSNTFTSVAAGFP